MRTPALLGLPDLSSRVYGNPHDHMALAYCMPANIMPHAGMRLNSSSGLLLDRFCTSCFLGDPCEHGVLDTSLLLKGFGVEPSKPCSY